MDDKQAVESKVDGNAEEKSRNSGVNRREVIKTGAKVLGASYLAPATLNLLMADRATAQSVAPPPRILDVIIGNLNDSSGVMTVNYTSAAGAASDTLGINTGNTFSCVFGTSLTISVSDDRPPHTRDIWASTAGGCAIVGNGAVTLTVNDDLIANTGCGWTGYHIACNN